MNDYKKIIDETIKKNPCYNCKNPNCVKGCPINQSIPTFIDYLKKEEYQFAYDTVTTNSVLPALCGALCPHEKQCEGHCIKGIKGRPVNIGILESTLAKMFDNSIKKINDTLASYQFAIIGGGIAGISAAFKIASFGGKVFLYEKNDSLGGAVKQSIPDFRFDDQIIDKITDNLKNMEVIINYNAEFGKNLSINDVCDNDYILFGLGTMIERRSFKNFENGVFAGCDILNEYKKTHTLPSGKKCLVIGAGNVAMDVSRAFSRNGYDTTIVYRRTLTLSPALKREINDALSDGVKFLELMNPVEPVYNNDRLTGLKVEIMKLSDDLDSSGRPKFLSTGDYRIIPTDLIVEAIGSLPDYRSITKLEFPIFENGWIKQNANKNFASYGKYYFIGDFVNGPTTVVNAMKSGILAVEDIMKNLKVN